MSKKKQPPKPVEQRQREEDVMDGAVFTMLKDKTPADFMNGPDGKRPDSPSKAPWGSVIVKLVDGIEEKTLPPRFIWDKGNWKTVSQFKNSEEWNTWVVSGEGTPGNYEERHYVVPDEIAKEQIPDHPADWPESLKKSKHQSWRSKASVSSGLPFGILIRCLGCGHFYKPNDISDHAKNACPSVQDPVLWLMICECHEDDPQAAATVLPGFPYKAPEKEETLAEDLQEEAAAKVPDTVRDDSELVGD